MPDAGQSRRLRSQGRFDGFSGTRESPAAAELAMAARCLDRPTLGLPVVGVHAHAAVSARPAIRSIDARWAASGWSCVWGSVSSIRRAWWVSSERMAGHAAGYSCSLYSRRPARWGPIRMRRTGRGAPAPTSRRRDASYGQLPTQRGEGFTGQGPVGQLLDDGGLSRLDGAEVHAAAVASWTTVGAAAFGQLLPLAADPAGDVVGLLGVDGGQDAGPEQVVGVADVDLARDGGDLAARQALADQRRPGRLATAAAVGTAMAALQATRRSR
jgi:hypothetical protein